MLSGHLLLYITAHFSLEITLYEGLHYIDVTKFTLCLAFTNN